MQCQIRRTKSGTVDFSLRRLDDSQKSAFDSSGLRAYFFSAWAVTDLMTARRAKVTGGVGRFVV